MHKLHEQRCVLFSRVLNKTRQSVKNIEKKNARTNEQNE